ncbi:MAG: MFS transporter [Anaerolineae bacterium]
MISLLALAEFLAMAVWFSASSVVDDLTTLMQLDDAGQSWLTMSVQIGFVVGALTASIFTLADRFSARRLFVLSSFGAAIATALIPTVMGNPALVMGLRFLTGIFLAGVYPVGMKIMATWTDQDRGLGIGLLVGALTLGSAAPHLLNSFDGFADWRNVLLGAAGLAAIGGVIALLFVDEGENRTPTAQFNFSDIQYVLKNRPVMLANLGYLGHMWELYAMWAWLSLFLTTSFAQVNVASEFASLITFLAIGIGGIGSVIAGKIADRIGRSTVTSFSMLISGSCALFIGQLWGGSPALVSAVALVWGLFIVADSAQFSASVTELIDRRYMGTALTLQTSLGFLLTLFSIRMLPLFVEWVSWRWAFSALAIGPVIGIIAMQILQIEQDQAKTATAPQMR